jgi:hypothetical protein
MFFIYTWQKIANFNAWTVPLARWEWCCCCCIEGTKLCLYGTVATNKPQSGVHCSANSESYFHVILSLSLCVYVNNGGFQLTLLCYVTNKYHTIITELQVNSHTKIKLSSPDILYALAKAKYTSWACPRGLVTQSCPSSHCYNNYIGSYCCNNDPGYHCCLWYQCYICYSPGCPTDIIQYAV